MYLGRERCQNNQKKEKKSANKKVNIEEVRVHDSALFVPFPLL